MKHSQFARLVEVPKHLSLQKNNKKVIVFEKNSQIYLYILRYKQVVAEGVKQQPKTRRMNARTIPYNYRDEHPTAVAPPRNSQGTHKLY